MSRAVMASRFECSVCVVKISRLRKKENETIPLSLVLSLSFGDGGFRHGPGVFERSRVFARETQAQVHLKCLGAFLRRVHRRECKVARVGQQHLDGAVHLLQDHTEHSCENLRACGARTVLSGAFFYTPGSYSSMPIECRIACATASSLSSSIRDKKERSAE